MAYTKNHVDNILKAYNGEVVNIDDFEITHIAFGDGTTPAAETDTQLENERYRKAFTIKARDIGEVETVVSLLQPEANDFDIFEVGIFANGTAAVNSGVLISRIVYSVKLQKAAGSILNYVRRDKVVK